jgi:hypothetical protein
MDLKQIYLKRANSEKKKGQIENERMFKTDMVWNGSDSKQTGIFKNECMIKTTGFETGEFGADGFQTHGHIRTGHELQTEILKRVHLERTYKKRT